MFQPAHQGSVLPQFLHPVDTEVVIVRLVFTGAFCHHQWPGDQRGRLSRPAGLDRQQIEVNILSGQDHFLTRSGFHRFRPHAHHGFKNRQHSHGFADALRGFRLAQEGKGFTDLAQFFRFAVHAHGDTIHSTEQIDENRHVALLTLLIHRIFKQDSRAAFG